MSQNFIIAEFLILFFAVIVNGIRLDKLIERVNKLERKQ